MNSNSVMLFKPTLTRVDSAAIQERSSSSPDLRALLWEVARLRAPALRPHEYSQRGSSSTALTLADSLPTRLEDEPAVQEQTKLLPKLYYSNLLSGNKGLRGCDGQLDNTACVRKLLV